MAELFGVITAGLGLLGVIDAAMSLGSTLIDYVKDFHDHNNAQQRLVSEVNCLQTLLPLVKDRLEGVKTSNNSAYKAAAEALEAQNGPLFQYGLALERIKKELRENERPGSTTGTPVTPASSSTSLPSQSSALPKLPRSKWMSRSLFKVGKWKSSKSPSQAPLGSTSTFVTPSASTTLREASNPTFRQRLTWPSTLDDIDDDLARIDRFKATVNLILTAGSPDDIARRLNPQFDLIREGIDKVRAKVEGVGNNVRVVAKDIKDVGENVGELVLDKNDKERCEVAEWLSDAQSTTPPFAATPGTGQWLIRSETFANWENGHFQVLFCPGNAGTGKTTLMTIALRYLDRKYINDSKRVTIRFHFNYQASANLMMPNLLAYILKQLLLHRALSTTMEKLLPYQRKPPVRPSEAEILSLLCDEIKTYDRVYVVLDALDESHNDIAFSHSRSSGQHDQLFDITAHNEDLRKYVKAFFEDNPRLCNLIARTNEVDQETVTSKVLEKARGMFLLVRLTLEQLKTQNTPNKLKAALESLPSDLYKMYELTIARSPNSERTFRLLCWVFVARRPVSPDELDHAMAWRLEAMAPLDDQDLEGEGQLLSSCGGLVEIRENKVVFIHYTTQEYIANILKQQEEHQSSLPPFLSGILTHADIALLSLRYIEHHLTEATLTSPPPLLQYCIDYWLQHSYQSTKDHRVNDAVFDFLTDTKKMELLNTFQGERSGLHLVARSGLRLPVGKLYDTPETFKAKGMNRTPLHLAVSNGHRAIVKVLWATKGVGVNAEQDDGWTPLHLAIVKALLATKGVDVNAKPQDGSEPHHLAVLNGDFETVKALLAGGIGILRRHVAQGAFHDSFERSDPPRCHPDTRHAILEEILNWITDPDNLKIFLWIFGPRGGGKTAIAQTIAEWCAAAGFLAASYFFSPTASRENFNHLVPTLAYQLALHIPEILEDLSFALKHDPSIFSRTLATQIQVLILRPLNAAAEDPLKRERMEKRPNVVVLDGLDQCGNRRSQWEVLEVLLAKMKLLTVPIFFLITSRPEAQIRIAFSKPEAESQTLGVALDETLNPDDDIRSFLETEFGELRTNYPSIPDAWPGEDVIHHIVQKSSGQFIYAATVMKFMHSRQHSPVKMLKIVLGAPRSNRDTPFAELDALYQQFLLSINDLEGAMDLLTLLALQDRDRYYLTVDFCENLLAYDAGEVLAILSDMRAFVHVPKPDDPYDTIRIHHASLPDFLFDRSRSGRFFIDSRYGHAIVATHWIKFVQRPPLSHLGVHTVVRPRGSDNVIITVERIIEHCTQSHLTNELFEALSTFNLEAHFILYPGLVFTELIQSISGFLRWLKPKNLEFTDTRWKLYRYHLTYLDNWILNQLSLFPREMRPILPAAFIFEGHFSSSPRALFDILSHKRDLIPNSFSRIEYSNTHKDFWFICQEFGGAPLFDLFDDFFTDFSRSNAYFVDPMRYAELACLFLDYIQLTPEGKFFSEHQSDPYVPSGNQYKINETEDVDVVLIRAALEFLPPVLSVSPKNADLVQGLKDHALQLKTSDPLHEKRLKVAIASFEYLKKVEFAFEEHSHKPGYDVCIICLLQPDAIMANQEELT